MAGIGGRERRQRRSERRREEEGDKERKRQESFLGVESMKTAGDTVEEILSKNVEESACSLHVRFPMR